MLVKRSNRPYAAVIVLAAAVSACTGSKSGSKASLPPPASPSVSGAVGTQSQPPAPEAQPQPGATGVAAGLVTTPQELPPISEPLIVSTSPAPQEAVQFRLAGSVDAQRRSQVAFRVAGFIAIINARPGALLKQGDVLAALDDRDFILKVDLAKARRDQAKVAAEAATREFARETQLKAEGASTATVFDKVKVQLDQGRLALKLAELDLESAQRNLHDTRLTAPYDCVVAGQLKHESESVQSGTGVFDIYDTNEPEISLTAPERLLGSVKVGTRLQVSVPSVGYIGPADVIRLVPVISEKTRTFAVTAKLLKYDTRIVPGLYAEGTLN